MYISANLLRIYRDPPQRIQRDGKLVIVESPAKARTVGRFLGKGYKVRASIGHVRDLLRSKLSVDVDNDFKPRYRVPNEKKEVVKELWDKLPEEYHHSHTYGVLPGEKTRQFGEFPDFDMSAGGFECICSEDIIPALEKNLKRQVFIPATAFARRFFDAMFGPNFDLSNPFDLQFFVNVITRDEVAIATGELKPETFFGVYSKR